MHSIIRTYFTKHINILTALNDTPELSSMLEECANMILECCNRKGKVLIAGNGGPNEYHKGSQCSVIYSFYNQLKTGNSLHLFKSYKTEYKDGEQRRDFVWIEDCVNVVLWMIEHTEVFGIYNVGSGIPRTFNDIARIISSTLNRECHIEYIDMPEGLKEQYQYHTQADISKLRSIGYNTPMTSLEKGISEYINNFLNTNDRYL